MAKWNTLDQTEKCRCRWQMLPGFPLQTSTASIAPITIGDVCALTFALSRCAPYAGALCLAVWMASPSGVYSCRKFWNTEILRTSQERQYRVQCSKSGFLCCVGRGPWSITVIGCSVSDVIHERPPLRDAGYSYSKFNDEGNLNHFWLSPVSCGVVCIFRSTV